MKNLILITFFLFLGACANPTCPSPEENRDIDPLVHDFRITVVNDPILLAPGRDTEIIVRVDRHPDFDTPVLVEAFGLPEYVSVHTRENREEDIDGITVLVVHTLSQEETSGDSPGYFRIPRFVVQGTDGEGTLHPYTAQFTVELDD